MLSDRSVEVEPRC